jgi:hypothetical protein
MYLYPKPVLTPRVLLLIHNPYIQKFGKRLNRLLNWKDPDQLCKAYIDDVTEASYGYVRYRIVERIELDEFPVKEDGFRYTDDSYLRCWLQARSDFHDPDTADYAAILKRSDFVRKLERRTVDELWLVGFPYAGYHESCMGGRGAVWCNGPVIPDTQKVSRRFVVMGFNFERDVGMMLHSLGHRAESIMEYVFRDVPDDSPPDDRSTLTAAGNQPSGAQSQDTTGGHSTIGARRPTINLNGNLWQQFIRYEDAHPGLAGCGKVHWAPSSQRAYDLGDSRPVVSNADDWLNYPNVTGQSRTLTSDDWGKGDEREHHLWWMKRFPHVEGKTPTGKLNNWWRFVVGLEF